MSHIALLCSHSHHNRHVHHSAPALLNIIECTHSAKRTLARLKDTHPSRSRSSRVRCFHRLRTRNESSDVAWAYRSSSIAICPAVFSTRLFIRSLQSLLARCFTRASSLLSRHSSRTGSSCFFLQSASSS